MILNNIHSIFLLKGSKANSFRFFFSWFWGGPRHSLTTHGPLKKMDGRQQMGPRAIIWTPRRGVSWCYQDDFHVTSNFSWPANTDLEAELTGQSVTSRVCPPWGSPNDMTDRLKRKTETCKLIRLDSWFSPPPKPNYRWMYNIQESTVPSEVLRKTTCTSGKENDLFPHIDLKHISGLGSKFEILQFWSILFESTLTNT